MKTTPVLFAAMALAALGATGCGNLPTAAPNVDARFGQSVRATMSAQIANPAAGLDDDTTGGFDAQSARHALTKHRESFKTPPPTFSIIGIGGGGGQ